MPASAHRTLKLYDGHYHDLLAGYGKEEVMANIASWINERSPMHQAA